MTKLLWDQVGDRRFEAGCDRGVLYLPDGNAVPWNGLTSVTDDMTDMAVEKFFLDGIKYLDRRAFGDYAGTLTALTYPREFEQFEGTSEVVSGVYGTGQPVNETFGLSYRTRVGNDEEGIDYGYRVHLLYNLTAKPDNKVYPTLNASATAQEFSWTLAGTPILIPGLRPSVHLIVDSTRVANGYMPAFEDIIYGSSSTDPSLPDVETLMQFQGDIITEPITEPL